MAREKRADGDRKGIDGRPDFSTMQWEMQRESVDARLLALCERPPEEINGRWWDAFGL
jgi:hypothetical protein